MPPNTVYVGRPGLWGNPYLVGAESYGGQTIEKSLYAYRHMFLPGRDLGDLRGKNLACWCPMDEPCHSDVLLELAN